MDRRRRGALAVVATVTLFVLVQVGALALVSPFDAAGFQATENPGDPTNSVVYIGAILVATAFMLGVLKFDADWLLRGFVVFASALMALYVFVVVIPPVVTITVGGASVNVLAFLASGVLALALLTYPEWYVIDAAGVVMGAGAAGLFGISFGLLPAIVLLAALAVYDAISVYGTEHMLALADGVMDLKLPVLLVIPLSLSYSFLDAESDDEDASDADESDATSDTGTGADTTAAADGGADADGTGADIDGNTTDADTGDSETDDEARDSPDIGDRDALFIGLGDAVMPTVMVASAAHFAPASDLGVPGIALTLPSLTAMVGTLLGLGVLLWMVLKGRAHAGLPLLNGGAIGGYIVGALASGIPLVTALGLGPYL